MVTFLLEIGTEELPASFVARALDQLLHKVPEALRQARLLEASTEVQTVGTPRRLSVLVQNLALHQPDHEMEVKGPPARVAFDTAGKPTAQAEGFARKTGVDVADLYSRETEKGPFVFALQKTTGQPTAQVLSSLIPDWIASLQGTRFMRWGNGDLRFSRPIRWLVVLLGPEILPVTVDGVASGRTSQGHRILHPNPVELTQADEYVEVMRRAFVMVDPVERAKTIRAQIEACARAAAGAAEIPPDLLDEVVNLVEWPTAVPGRFEPEFLKLPGAVIKTTMIANQRYFPVHAPGSDHLLPLFITVSNGDPAHAETIARGNERVIRARLADARFFFEEDRKRPLATFLAKLARVTFQEDLGTVADRIARIEYLSDWLCQYLNYAEDEHALVSRTASLCKADLATQMVYEFPELQGIVGSDYARLDGEPEAVALGISEHYLPRNSQDQLPTGFAGRLVGIADRLDVLVGIFGLGLLPSGSSDPFALRRAALTLVQVSWDARFTLDLVAALNAALDLYEERGLLKQPRPVVLEQLVNWFAQRLYGLLVEEEGFDFDLVLAVLGPINTSLEYALRGFADLQALRLRLEAVRQARQSGVLTRVYETAVRTARLAAKVEAGFDDLDTGRLDRGLLQEPAEKALYEQVEQFILLCGLSEQKRDYAGLLAAIEPLTLPISRFFEDVLVIAPEPELQRNRLRLLAIINNNVLRLLDVREVVMVGG